LVLLVLVYGFYTIKKPDAGRNRHEEFYYLPIGGFAKSRAAPDCFLLFNYLLPYPGFFTKKEILAIFHSICSGAYWRVLAYFF